jgi:hypothetical protein
MHLGDLIIFTIGWMNKYTMIIRGIKYIFYSIYKITSINYGKEGGAYASFVIVSMLLSINAITIIGIFNKLILRRSNISMVLLGFLFFLILIIDYFILIRNLRYKKIIFEESQINKVNEVIRVLMYVIISLGLLIIVITIKT